MRATTVRQPGARIARAARHSARGVALIEVLVALLIFMLGILGLIGLQGSLTRAQSDAKIRADAAYLASELLGRMWADTDNLDDYAGTDSCTASSCTEWRTKVAGLLPGGGANVTVNGVNGDVAVTVSWTTQDGVAHQYQTYSTIASKMSN